MALVTSSSSALAEEPAWLVWKAPPECPTAVRIAETLEQWLKRPLERDEARVTAAVHASEAGWDVTVLVVQRELEGERSVRTRTCSEAADFVALSVALSIDPGLVGSLPEPAPAEAPPPAEQNEVEGKAASSARDTGSALVSKPSESEAAAPPDAARERPPATRAPPTEQGSESGLVAYAQLGGVFDLLALPSPRLGLGGQISLRVSRLTVSGGVRWLPSRTEPVPAAVSDVEFSLLTGRALVGYSFSFGDVELEPFVEAELGRTFAESPRYSSSARWLALGAGAQATWRATSVLEPYAAIGALFPLERPTFVLSGGTEVHRVPTMTAVADAGIRINF